jgi:hypothetical protein
MKEGNIIISPLLLGFVSEYALRKVQEIQE